MLVWLASSLLGVSHSLATNDTDSDGSMDGWTDRIRKALPVELEIAVDPGNDNVRLTWTERPTPDGPIRTKLTASILLWRKPDAAQKSYRKAKEAQTASLALPVEDPIEGWFGAKAGDWYAKDAAGNYHPRAQVEAQLLCGDISARFTAEAEGQFEREDLKGSDPSSWAPEIMEAYETLKGYKKAFDEAVTAIRVVGGKVAKVFETGDICERERQPATSLSDLLERYVTVMTDLGFPPQDSDKVRERARTWSPPTLEEIEARDYGYYETFNLVWEQIEEGDSIYSERHSNTRHQDQILVQINRSDELSYSGAIAFIEKEAVEEFDVGSRTGARAGVSTVGTDGQFYDLSLLRFAVKTTTRIACGIDTEIRLFRVRKAGEHAYPIPADVDESANQTVAMMPGQQEEAKAFAVQFVKAMEDAGISCGDRAQPLEAPAELTLELLDANPAFAVDGKEPLELETAQLVDFDVVRQAVSADGTSRVILRVPLEARAQITLRLDDGSADTPSGGLLSLADASEDDATPSSTLVVDSNSVDDEHYAFAVYVPPDVFGPLHRGEIGDVGTRDVAVKATVDPVEADAETEEHEVTITLARPPLLLVHGTYSSPEKWRESSPLLAGRSLKQALESRGFRVFLVDYEKTNGSSNLRSSRFDDNRSVVWENEGGISEALEHYRDTQNIAVTRVDVVGHSLGGLLPRLHASVNFKKPGEDEYRRPANFGQGDIGRLITLCTPHYGSDLPDLLGKLLAADYEGVSFWDAAKAKAVAFWAAYQAGWKSGAAEDQAPKSNALKRIGATEIPSHAIVCLMQVADMFKPIFSDRAREERNFTYRNTFGDLAAFFATNQGAMKAAFREPERDWNAYREPDAPTCGVRGPAARRGKNDYERLTDMISAIDWEAWRESPWDEPLYRRRCDTPIDCFLDDVHKTVTGLEWAANEAVLESQIDEEERAREEHWTRGVGAIDESQLMHLMRAAIFGNTPNDGTVRFESQIGGLEEGHFTIVDNLQHGEAPLYESVQNTVMELLTGPMSAFDKAGFPDAGRAVADQPPGLHIQRPQERLLAIARSNIVPAQAEAIAKVAQARNEIIIARPVNADSTGLIAAGAATKNMHVKGKSADWGPQKGFIAVDQAFSKLAGDTAAVGKYNCEVVKTLKKPEPLAAKRQPLRVKIGNKEYDVRKLEQKVAGRQRPVIGLREVGCEDCSYRDWQNPNAAPPVAIDDSNSLALEVLTPPDSAERYLTADYDLLAVGGRYRDPIPDEMDPERGFITTCQKDLVGEINRTIEKLTGHEGGDVVHHGPENQFTMSPGNDYPVTAFEPGSHGGFIRTIRQGPSGQQDLNLKRYFFEKQTQGWELWPNKARWGWGEPDPEAGYAPEDPPSESKDLTSDDNDDKKPPAGPNCDPLPPCHSTAFTGSWEIPKGVSPAEIGCWPEAPG